MAANSSDNGKQRLDRLIRKGRVHLYKPMMIAEVLYRDRIHRDIELSNVETYRRESSRWRDAVSPRLVGKKGVLNSRYEDQLFNEEVLPPRLMVELGEANRAGDGCVECYIYFALVGRYALVAEINERLRNSDAETFDLRAFLTEFETPALRRSMDKAYEIVVYALFDALVRHLGATVTLSISPDRQNMLADFERFAFLVLGVTTDRPTVSQPARLYRVGTTNAADAGLDMWANFGPAVQVKHMTLDASRIGEIVLASMADQVVIVCVQADKSVIETVLRQSDMAGRIRGFVTEANLVEWYGVCQGRKYAATLGREVVAEVSRQFALEFPLGGHENVAIFCAERGYSANLLRGDWALDDVPAAPAEESE